MEELPKQPNILPRNGRLYFRKKVPKELVSIIGKTEIKKSLKTSDLKEAKIRLPIEQLKAEEMFAEARKQLLPAPSSLEFVQLSKTK